MQPVTNEERQQSKAFIETFMHINGHQSHQILLQLKTVLSVKVIVMVIVNK